jgi:hypothetical protein
MDSFPIVEKGDVEAHGAYRTVKLIIEISDQFVEAMKVVQPSR